MREDDERSLQWWDGLNPEDRRAAQVCHCPAGPHNLRDRRQDIRCMAVVEVGWWGSGREPAFLHGVEGQDNLKTYIGSSWSSPASLRSLKCQSHRARKINWTYLIQGQSSAKIEWGAKSTTKTLLTSSPPVLLSSSPTAIALSGHRTDGELINLASYSWRNWHYRVGTPPGKQCAKSAGSHNSRNKIR